jgi:hypothetical protein
LYRDFLPLLPVQNRETAIENVAKRVCDVSPHVPSRRAIQQGCSSPVPNPTLIRKALGRWGTPYEPVPKQRRLIYLSTIGSRFYIPSRGNPVTLYKP